MIPRLRFEELDPELRVALSAKVQRLGYLGEFFAVAGHQPGALSGFVRMTHELKSSLPSSITEIVALSVAAETGNTYELHQHERLALRQGKSEQWVRDVESDDPASTTELDDDERAVAQLARSMVRTLGRQSAADVERVHQRLGVDATVAVLLTVCRYVGHATVVLALGIDAPVSSPLTTEQGASAPGGA